MFFEYHLLLQHSIEVFIFFITFFAERRILRKIRRNIVNQKLNSVNYDWESNLKTNNGTTLLTNLMISQLIIHSKPIFLIHITMENFLSSKVDILYFQRNRKSINHDKCADKSLKNCSRAWIEHYANIFTEHKHRTKYTTDYP